MRSAKPEPTIADQVLPRLAQAVRVVVTICVVSLVLGIVLVMFRGNVNEDNPIAALILNISEFVDGPFSRDGGVFSFSGDGAVTKEAITNWGLAAIVWVVIGRVLSRLLNR